MVCKAVLTLRSEYAFVIGVTLLGFISIGGGFVRDKIILIVLRALSGIGIFLPPLTDALRSNPSF